MKNLADDILGWFYYGKAGKKAPKGVKREIARYRQMPENKYKRNRPLLFHLLGGGTQPYKMTKEESEYVDKSVIKGQTCGNCKSAYNQVATGRILCSQIQQEIRLAGYCRLWVSPEEHQPYFKIKDS